MNITKDILDRKMCEFEECYSENLTYRQWIRENEVFYNLEHKDLDSMTDKELKQYDDFIYKLILKQFLSTKGE